MIDEVIYGAEDWARVAELLLAAHEIPARVRSGILPEVLERELSAARTLFRREIKAAGKPQHAAAVPRRATMQTAAAGPSWPAYRLSLQEARLFASVRTKSSLCLAWSRQTLALCRPSKNTRTDVASLPSPLIG